MITLIPGIGSRFARAFLASMNCPQARLALVGALLLAFIGSAVMAGPPRAGPVFPPQIWATGRFFVGPKRGALLLSRGAAPPRMGPLIGTPAPKGPCHLHT